MERIQPFLKWAGGKSKLVERITALFPKENSGRYFEPFVGGGAVALNAGFKQVTVNDINPDLTYLFFVIQKRSEALIECCRGLFTPENNRAEVFYQLRDEFNTRPSDLVRRSALFLYLNKHGFNGLCRYNKSGKFNVPFGKYKTVSFDESKIRTASEIMRTWEITCEDFLTVIEKAGAGDVVYCDPPYVSDDEVMAGFTSYAKEGFGFVQQELLARAARKAFERGATVIVSNHDTEWTRKTYRGYGAVLHTFEVQRNISCDGTNRHKASELLAVFAPVKKELDTEKEIANVEH